MRTSLAAITVLALTCLAGAQQLPSTADVMRVLRANAPVLVAIVHCKTAACAGAALQRIEDPGEAALVTYYSKVVAIEPHNRTAALGLLRALPKSEAEAGGLFSMATYLFSGETDAEVDALASVYWDLNERVASALALWPNMLASFIRYGEATFTDMESDFPDRAARICRANPARFLRAFRQLSPPDQCYFSHRILDPHGCHQIAVPEAP